MQLDMRLAVRQHSSIILTLVAVGALASILVFPTSSTSQRLLDLGGKAPPAALDPDSPDPSASESAATWIDTGSPGKVARVHVSSGSFLDEHSSAFPGAQIEAVDQLTGDAVQATSYIIGGYDAPPSAPGIVQISDPIENDVIVNAAGYLSHILDAATLSASVVTNDEGASVVPVSMVGRYGATLRFVAVGFNEQVTGVPNIQIVRPSKCARSSGIDVFESTPYISNSDGLCELQLSASATVRYALPCGTIGSAAIAPGQHSTIVVATARTRTLRLVDGATQEPLCDVDIELAWTNEEGGSQSSEMRSDDRGRISMPFVHGVHKLRILAPIHLTAIRVEGEERAADLVGREWFEFALEKHDADCIDLLCDARAVLFTLVDAATGAPFQGPVRVGLEFPHGGVAWAGLERAREYLARGGRLRIHPREIETMIEHRSPRHSISLLAQGADPIRHLSDEALRSGGQYALDLCRTVRLSVVWENGAPVNEAFMAYEERSSTLIGASNEGQTHVGGTLDVPWGGGNLTLVSGNGLIVVEVPEESISGHELVRVEIPGAPGSLRLSGWTMPEEPPCLVAVREPGMPGIPSVTPFVAARAPGDWQLQNVTPGHYLIGKHSIIVTTLDSDVTLSGSTRVTVRSGEEALVSWVEPPLIEGAVSGQIATRERNQHLIRAFLVYPSSSGQSTLTRALPPLDIDRLGKYSLAPGSVAPARILVCAEFPRGAWNQRSLLPLALLTPGESIFIDGITLLIDDQHEAAGSNGLTVRIALDRPAFDGLGTYFFDTYVDINLAGGRLSLDLYPRDFPSPQIYNDSGQLLELMGDKAEEGARTITVGGPVVPQWGKE